MKIIDNPQYKWVQLSITVGIPLVLVLLACSFYGFSIESKEALCMAALAGSSQALVAWLVLHSRKKNISSTSQLFAYLRDWGLISSASTLASIALVLKLAL